MSDLLTIDDGTATIARPREQSPELALPTPAIGGPSAIETIVMTSPSTVSSVMPVPSASHILCTVTVGSSPDPTRKLIAYLALFSNLPARGAADRDVQRPVSELVDLLRTSAGLTVTELADVLAVSRRALYTWSARGALSKENQRRLSGVAHALEPLAQSWSPGHVRMWLDQTRPAVRALLRSGEYEEVRRLALESLASEQVTLRRGRRVTDHLTTSDHDDLTIDRETRMAYLSAFSQRRTAATTVEWQPPEVTGMGNDDDDDE